MFSHIDVLSLSRIKTYCILKQGLKESHNSTVMNQSLYIFFLNDYFQNSSNSYNIKYNAKEMLLTKKILQAAYPFF